MMVALLLALYLDVMPDYQIYGPGAVSYADLNAVVARRHWEGTERFDLLIAPADCRLLGRWAWVITPHGVKNALICDCEAPKDAGGLEKAGLLFDGNDWELVGDWPAFMVVR